MDDIAFAAVAMATAVLIATCFTRRAGIYQLPFLAGAVVAGWFLPQAWGLLDETTLPPGGYALTMFYTAACLVAILYGERFARPVRQDVSVAFHTDRLLMASAALSIIGLFAYSQIFNVERETNALGQTTGLVTILFFFAQLKYYGLAIAFSVLLRQFSWVALAIIFLDLNAIMGFVLWGGRRAPAVALVLIVLTILWFQRRLVVPHILFLPLIVVGALLANNIDDYRRLVVNTGRLPTVGELMSLESIKDSTGYGSNFEARNAIYHTAATHESMRLEYGIGYWNFLVFSYVPGQLVGHDMKRFLTIETVDNAAAIYGYRSHPGTTMTGFAESFLAFWIFGAVVFAVISAVMRQWWLWAMAGRLDGVLLYALAISVALQGITHSTRWFVADVLQIFVFVLPVLVWAKRPRPRNAASASAAMPPIRAPYAGRVRPSMGE